MAPRIIEGVEGLKAIVGQEIGKSDWIEITQDRINSFADATEDHQWIHVDVERAAKESPFGATIAHGFLTLSLLPHMAAQTVKVQGNFKMGINYGLNRLRFPSPVRVGSKVQGRFTLQAVEEVSGGIQITWSVAIQAEGSEKPCLAAEWVTRYY